MGDGPGSVDWRASSMMDGFRLPLIRGRQVHARYGGYDRWLRGKITAVRKDGTLNITYEDGETETGVARELVRACRVVTFQA